MRAALALGIAFWLTICDHVFHVWSHTLGYPQSVSWDGQAWWVPLTFAPLGAAVVLVAPRIAAPDATASWPRLGTEVALVSALYAASGWIPGDTPAVFTAALAALFVTRALLHPRRGEVLTAAALLAVGGVLAEALLVRFGAMGYARPDVLGVPLWLGALYANAAFAALEGGALVRRADAPATVVESRV